MQSVFYDQCYNIDSLELINREVYIILPYIRSQMKLVELFSPFSTRVAWFSILN